MMFEKPTNIISLVSQISLSSRRDFLHLAEIGEILPYNWTLSVSSQDFERYKLLTDIAKI